MKKRGQVFTLFTLVELVLAVALLFMVWFITVQLIDNNTFFQSFYAKDNAYIIETLHAVPNGELHISYLWKNEGFLLDVNPVKQEVLVAPVLDEVDKMDRYTKMKLFGTSQLTQVQDTEKFSPKYYQYIRTRSTILIEQQFSNRECKTVNKPLTGVTLVGSGESGGMRVQDLLIDTRRGAEASLAKQVPEQGTSIRFVVERADTPYTGVYLNALDDQATRLHCIITRQASVQQNVAERPETPLNYEEDIVVVVKTSSGAEVTQVLQAIKDALVTYGGLQ
jgi:hypothetical protein